jgi:hypothetical protein
MPCRPRRGSRGKLKAAARAWASGRGGVRKKADDILTQAAIMPEWMEERMAAESRELELAPDEATPFSLFLSLGTQWARHAMTGVRLGLDYSVIPSVAQMMGIALTPPMFLDLRIMEGAALDEFARAKR